MRQPVRIVRNTPTAASRTATVKTRWAFSSKYLVAKIKSVSDPLYVMNWLDVKPYVRTRTVYERSSDVRSGSFFVLCTPDPTTMYVGQEAHWLVSGSDPCSRKPARSRKRGTWPPMSGFRLLDVYNSVSCTLTACPRKVVLDSKE